MVLSICTCTTIFAVLVILSFFDLVFVNSIRLCESLISSPSAFICCSNTCLSTKPSFPSSAPSGHRQNFIKRGNSHNIILPNWCCNERRPQVTPTPQQTVLRVRVASEEEVALYNNRTQIAPTVYQRPYDDTATQPSASVYCPQSRVLINNSGEYVPLALPDSPSSPLSSFSTRSRPGDRQGVASVAASYPFCGESDMIDMTQQDPNLQEGDVAPDGLSVVKRCPRTVEDVMERQMRTNEAITASDDSECRKAVKFVEEDEENHIEVREPQSFVSRTPLVDADGGANKLESSKNPVWLEGVTELIKSDVWDFGLALHRVELMRRGSLLLVEVMDQEQYYFRKQRAEEEEEEKQKKAEEQATQNEKQHSEIDVIKPLTQGNTHNKNKPTADLGRRTDEDQRKDGEDNDNSMRTTYLNTTTPNHCELADTYTNNVHNHPEKSEGLVSEEVNDKELTKNVDDAELHDADPPLPLPKELTGSSRVGDESLKRLSDSILRILERWDYLRQMNIFWRADVVVSSTGMIGDELYCQRCYVSFKGFRVNVSFNKPYKGKMKVCMPFLERTDTHLVLHKSGKRIPVPLEYVDKVVLA
eukprot:GHVQ01022249.1.p1 GENE.GHVQ01022249.1~~GHVQ01022249.1.p1  ORF type:complete len:588 (+),score=87.09 GHVQ01022249.1:118-1881(+)